MDENKTPIQAALIGFSLTIVGYQLIFGISGWGYLLAPLLAAGIAAAAYFGAKTLA